MAESVALVAHPFYAPVRTDTGPFFKFGQTARRPLLFEQQVGIVAPEPDEGMTYCRDGRFIADTRIGNRLNIYV